MKAITYVTKGTRRVYTCRTVWQAEKWISEREKRDPKGVAAGHYGIDPNELAYKRWNENFKRRKLK